MSVRAAVITAIGEDPVAIEIDEPRAGDPAGVMLRMLTVGLSPIDLTVAAGRFGLGHPPLPYIPGHEGVGVVDERTVYVAGSGIGVTADGLCADLRTVPQATLIDLPGGADPVVAAALGTAGVAGWSAVTRRAGVSAGETVIVRGASGAAGRVAVQAARAAGAARVIGVGRPGVRLEAVAHLCDAVVAEGDDLGPRIMEAAGGVAPVLVDFMWGPAAGSAFTAVAPDGRVVLAGGGAGPIAEIASPVVIGRRLDIRGYSNFGLSPEDFRTVFLDLVDRAGSGALEFPVTAVPLARVGEAWTGTRSSTGKFVVDLRADGGTDAA
jgi:NADPH:quinone reductase-like Zn-dependent oxidoreductase